MEHRNKAIRTKKFVSNDGEATADVSSDVGELVAGAEQNSGDETYVPDDTLTEEEKVKEAESELIREGFESPNLDQINQFISSNVRFKTEYRGRTENFMSSAYIANVLIITLNCDHAFYKQFVEKLFKNDDDRIAFQLLLTALVKSTQELSSGYTEAMDLLFRKINDKVYGYMVEYSKKFSQD